MTCEHTELESEARIHHLADTGKRIAEFTVRCALCRVPFQFVGAPTGLSMSRPTIDVPGTTLHVPIEPGERTLADLPNCITFSD